MPGGLGFHPFFAKTRGARLAFDALRVSNRRAGEFPTESVAVPVALGFNDGPGVEDREGTDHCFEDWGGVAIVADGARSFRLESSKAARYLIVYVPAGGDYFCAEPVTHAVNAMNRQDPARAGLWRLAAGEERRATLTLRPAVTRRD
jgi:aldose 1-epimerase